MSTNFLKLLGLVAGPAVGIALVNEWVDTKTDDAKDADNKLIGVQAAIALGGLALDAFGPKSLAGLGSGLTTGSSVVAGVALGSRYVMGRRDTAAPAKPAAPPAIAQGARVAGFPRGAQFVRNGG